jgi:ribosomal protein L10
VSAGLGKNMYIFCDEKDLKKILNLMKRTPHLVLLGGMINEQLFTRTGVQNYANMDSLDDLRGQLVATLNQQLASLTNTLSLPITNLSQSLSQYAKSETGQETKS